MKIYNQKCLLASGIALLIFAFVNLAVALTARLLIPNIMSQKIQELVVIDSAEHEDFGEFVTNTNADSPAKYNKLFFQNITNIQEFYQGANAKLVLIGPYVFREYYKRHNVEFLDNGNVVRYTEAVRNEFVPEMSIGSGDDRVTLINLPYFNVMTKYGSESNTLLYGALQVIGTTIAQMDVELVRGIKAATFAQIFTATFAAAALSVGRKQKLIERLAGECYSVQCKPIATPAGCLYNTSAAYDWDLQFTKISYSTMEMLLDAKNPFSITNSTAGYGINAWLQADGMDHSALLIDYFQLTNSQYRYVAKWVSTAAECRILRSLIFGKLNWRQPLHRKVQTWSDLPYRQWISGDVLSILQGGEPFSASPDAPFEFAFVVQDVSTAKDWSLEQVRSINCFIRNNASWAADFLLGFHDSPNKAEEFTLPSMDDHPLPLGCSIQKAFIKHQDVEAFRDYMRAISKTVVRQSFVQAIANGSGITATKTVLEHAFGWKEPLLGLVLDASDPRSQKHAMLPVHPLDDVPLCLSTADSDDDYTSCQLVTVNTTSGLVRDHYLKAGYALNTGKDDLRKIGSFAEVEGHERLHGLFAGVDIDIKQMHASNGEYFVPNNAAFNKLNVFVPSIVGQIDLNFTGYNHNLYDIALRRFSFQDFSRTGQQSFQALDMSEPKNVHVSCRVPQGDQFATYIDVEPFTGKAMRAQITAEIVLSNKAEFVDFDVYYQNVSKSFDIPVYVQQIVSEVNEPLANKFKSSVYSVNNLAHIAFIVGLILASVSLVLSVYLLRVYKINNRVLLE